MKKTVILSTNWNPNYLNYLEWTIKAWNMLGWDTLTFYTWETDLQLPDILTESTEQNRKIHAGHFPEYQDATIVQVSRLLAGNYIQDGIIMTGDVDMIPLANYWNPDADHITVYGFDLTGKTQYPICYIAMSAENWRSVIREYNLDELLKKYPIAKSPIWEKWWTVDQVIITERINQHKSEIPLCLIDRGFSHGLAQGRIDRADWERTVTMPDRKIDAHMLRPFNLEQTKRVMNLIQR